MAKTVNVLIIDPNETRAEQVPHPAVMFVDRSDGNASAKALETGVAGYIVDGYNPKRVSSILTVAADILAVSDLLKSSGTQ